MPRAPKAKREAPRLAKKIPPGFISYLDPIEVERPSDASQTEKAPALRPGPKCLVAWPFASPTKGCCRSRMAMVASTTLNKRQSALCRKADTRSARRGGVKMANGASA